jgi:cell wall-associated NlpC family hydrolase
MKHWASELIGKPWQPGATGPAAFYCWGLMQFVVESRLGKKVPPISLGQSENYGALLQAARTDGWRPVDRPPQEYDVAVMEGPNGRHVGIVIRANGHLGLLHADGCMTPNGPRGSVVFEDLKTITTGGYHHVTFWRIG